MNKIKGFNSFRISNLLKGLGSLKFSDSQKGSHSKRIDSPRESIIKWVGNIQSKEPIHKDPQDMVNSLLKVKAFIQANGESQSKADAERYDKGMLDKFQYLCSNLNLEFDRKYFKELKDEMGDMLLKEKYKWNIPRPYQVAEFMGIPYDERYKTETSSSPSYPSGHAGQANIIAEVLSKMYPEYSERFMRLANLIAFSRISAGVHFLPDIEEGRRLAHELIEKGLVKIPSNK